MSQTIPAPVQRLDPGPRASGIVVHDGIAYFTTIPDRPFSGTVADQTRQILRRVDERLARLGSSKSRILATQIWLADIATFGEMNAVWDAWVDPQNPPARWTGEAKLATPDYKVEIIVTAAV